MDQEKIGKKIRQIRMKNNLTQSQFAQKLGVTYQAVSKWENGKNLPDISILKKICSDFDLKLDDLLDNEKTQKNNFYYVPILCILIIVLILIIGIVLIINNHHNDFEFKTLHSTCEQFKISGSIAYNNEKSSIYISNIDYCGEENNYIYTEIGCTFYENFNNQITKISTCETKNNMTLTKYLEDIKLNVDNYNSICKKFKDSSLYLEINAQDEKGIITTYKIPLQFENNC